MGKVFLAYDEELNREVALKEIRGHHADNPAIRARFTMEARLTGGLEHPGVVPVYALDTHSDGRPFYAMRFVRGESLQEAIRRFHEPELPRTPAERSIAFRKLLGRFIDVCQTIQYAHSRGVLHRDLKPANIMLGEFGETLIVDWGLAKVVGGGDSAGNEADEPPQRPRQPQPALGETVAGAAVGTPSFISPEQAAGEHDRIGRHSDVYGLGATFYAILTGRAPFPGDDTGQVLDRVKAGQFEHPRQLARETPRALQAICLKAMALEPGDRYASAGKLAEDIEAWLADEAVSAYREPVTVGLLRWARRHRTVVMTTAAAVLVAVISLGLGVGLLATKNRQLHAANLREMEATRRAQQRFQLALEAMETYYNGVSEYVLLGEMHLSDLRKRLLETPLSFYQTLREQAHGDESAASSFAMARAYFAIARITGQVGPMDEAVKCYGEAIQVCTRLTEQHPDVAEYQHTLARSHGDLGLLQGRMGYQAKALEELAAAVTILQQLAEKHQDVDIYQIHLATYCSAIGDVHRELGNLQQSLEYTQEAVRIAETLCRETPGDDSYQSELAIHSNNLGITRRKMGGVDEAIRCYDRAIEIHRRLAAEFPENSNYRGRLADHYHNRADAQHVLGNSQQAVAHYRTAIEIREAMAAELPHLHRNQHTLATHYRLLAKLLRGRGNSPEAFAYYEKAMGVAEKLAARWPDVFEYQDQLAVLCTDWAQFQQELGDLDQARHYYQKAIQIRAPLAAEHPTISGHQHALGSCYFDLARLHGELGNLEEASACYGKVMRISEELVRRFPELPKYRAEKADLCSTIGVFLRARGDVRQARQYHRDAIQIQEKLVEEYPDNLEYTHALVRSYSNVVALQVNHAEPDETLRLCKRAIPIGESLVASSPTVTEYAVTLAGIYCNRGHLERQMDDPAESLHWYDKAMQALGNVLQRDQANQAARRFLANSHWGRAQALGQMGRHREAVADWDEVIAMEPKMRRYSRLQRARTLALAGDHALATHEAEQLAAGKKASGKTVHEVACVFALASKCAAGDETLSPEQRKELVERYASTAVELLDKARQLGVPDPKSADCLETNSDFDAPRVRQDFQDLIRQ